MHNIVPNSYHLHPMCHIQVFLPSHVNCLRSAGIALESNKTIMKSCEAQDGYVFSRAVSHSPECLCVAHTVSNIPISAAFDIVLLTSLSPLHAKRDARHFVQSRVSCLLENGAARMTIRRFLTQQKFLDEPWDCRTELTRRTQLRLGRGNQRLTATDVENSDGFRSQ